MLKLLQKLKADRFAYRIWRYNPAGLYRLYQHHRFDRQFGVETRGYGDPRYEPTPAPLLAKSLRCLDIDPRQFDFIDIGSGKGKVLLLASGYPFKAVIGVERFEDLHGIAVENLERFPRELRRCDSVASVCADARHWELPAEPTVFYFFNPFAEPLLREVLANIEGSLEAHPRTIYIVFYAPILRRGSPWDRRRPFDASACLRTLRDERALTLYTNVDAYR